MTTITRYLTLLACLAACATDDPTALAAITDPISTPSFAFNGLQFTQSSAQRAQAPVVMTAIDNLSLEAWVRWNGGAAGQLVAYNGDSSSSGYGIFIEPTGTIRVLVGGVGWATCDCAVTPDEWTHVAAVRDTGVWKIYRNGVAGNVSDAPGAPQPPTTGTFSVGGSQERTDIFNGGIDEVRAWTVARTQAEIARDLSVALFGDEPGLAAYYRLDEGHGLSSVNATAGGLPLSLSSPIWISSGAQISTGIARSTVEFGGSASARATNVVTTLTSGFTLEVWVRWDGGTAPQAVMYNGNNAANGYGIYVANGVAQFVEGGRGSVTCTTCTLVPGVWTHIAVERNASQVQMFQNGVLKLVSASLATPLSPGGVLSLASNTSGGDRLIGAVDEVRVWTILLPPWQIASDYTESLPDTQPDLAAYYRMDDGHGSIATDSSGAHPVTLFGTPAWDTSGAPLATAVR